MIPRRQLASSPEYEERETHLHNLGLLFEIRMKVGVGLSQVLAKSKGVNKGEVVGEEYVQRQERNPTTKVHHACSTYLTRIHLELANNLDGYLTRTLAGTVLGPVDVAEGAVAHLLQ